MTTYPAYLESGPRRGKTMVHVFEPLGCIATGASTTAALAATPEAIRSYATFLARHGEEVDVAGSIEVKVAEHVTQGDFLGNGSPQVIFAPDLVPPSVEEAARLLDRLGWLHADLASVLAEFDPRAIEREPSERARSVRAIVAHVIQNEGYFLWSLFGTQKDLLRVATSVGQGDITTSDAVTRSHELAAARLEAATEHDLGRKARHGKETWTARKVLRRLLEHAWEHRLEIEARR